MGIKRQIEIVYVKILTFCLYILSDCHLTIEYLFLAAEY